MKKSKLILIIVIVACLVVGIGSFVHYNSSLEAIQNESEQVVFVVNDGDTIDSVTANLEAQGIIKNASMARLNAKMSGNSNIAAGDFVLDKSWSTQYILEYINNPDNIDNQHSTLTFREGIWARDIANFLGQYLNVTAEEMLKQWNDESYIRSLMSEYSFLSEEMFSDGTRILLEGYLFPDTYQFDKDATPDTITRIFLNRFQEIYDRNNGFKDSGLSIHKLVTLASVVQSETGSFEEMGYVSSVFHNRLEIDMKIQSSVTVCYSLYDYDDPKECEIDFLIDSPYNTYVYEGLPLGPISNPGEHALQATAKPTESKYLYFIGDVCNSGKTFFAETYEEHEKNKEEKLSICGW